MADDPVEDYHFKRQRQCLAMAAAATDPCARQLHEQLAVEHHKLAAARPVKRHDRPRRSERASAADQLEDGDDHGDDEQDVDQTAGYVE